MQDQIQKLESDLKQARSQATLFDDNNHHLRGEIEQLRDELTAQGNKLFQASQARDMQVRELQQLKNQLAQANQLIALHEQTSEIMLNQSQAQRSARSFHGANSAMGLEARPSVPNPMGAPVFDTSRTEARSVMQAPFEARPSPIPDIEPMSAQGRQW